MKLYKITCLLIFCLIVDFVFAQTNVIDYNRKPTPRDGHSYVTHYDYENRVLEYPFVREDDILWTKTYELKIDLREKANHPLYFPEYPTSLGNGIWRKNLSNLLLDGVKSGRIIFFWKRQ